VKFYVGLHQPSDAQHFDRCMVSVNRLRDRRSDFTVREWMMDSGAFTEVTKHGGYRHGVEEYAEQVNRWHRCGDMVAASAQDWMCEPFAVAATGKSVAEHQQLTVERYAALRPLCPDAYVLPVLQGWHPADYASHIRQYGRLLTHGAWVGVGSVCKRNSSAGAIEDVLLAIHWERPDLRLHGFGLKLTALTSATVRDLLHSADSMAWSYSARKQGRNGNDWREAARFARRVATQPAAQTTIQWEAA
jgi:hypothetical protein